MINHTVVNRRRGMLHTIAGSVLCFALGYLPLPARAQVKDQKFRVFNRALSMDTPAKIIHLDERADFGVAWMTDQEFTNGEIEFDLKGVDKYQGSFAGIAFHGLKDSVYESIYFRPFNFRAPDSLRKTHAVQYISTPEYDWPLLRERFPGTYEGSMPAHIDPNEWFHVKIKVSSALVSVYVDGNESPVLAVRPLTHSGGKMIGYWVGNGSGGDWKNLKLSPQP